MNKCWSLLVNHLWKCLVKLLECTMLCADDPLTIGLHIFTFDHPVIPRSASLWQGCIHWKQMGVVNNWLMVSYCSMFNHIGDDDSQQHQQLVFLYSFMFLWHIPGWYCTRLERHPGVVFLQPWGPGSVSVGGSCGCQWLSCHRFVKPVHAWSISIPKASQISSLLSRPKIF